MGAYGSKDITFLKDATPTGSCSQALVWGKLPGLSVVCGADVGTAEALGIAATYLVDGVPATYVMVYADGVYVVDQIAASSTHVLENIVEQAIQLGGIRRFKLVLMNLRIDHYEPLNPSGTVTMRLIYNETR